MSYKFVMEEWLSRFPLDENAERYSGEIVTSPRDACNNEWLRRAMQDEYRWGPPAPVDIFIMAEGEPEDCSVTKIGGLPYRPAEAPWPTDEAGEPMLFLGQFDFTDSYDLTGPLPGDLLLVFGDSAGGAEDLEFEWQPKRLTSLIDADSVPEHPDAFDPCFGYICRTVGYPQAERVTPYDEERYPKCRGKDVWSDYLLPRWQATQIGGAPFFIQGDGDELPGRLLCTINSVQPDKHSPYPWVNHPTPLLAEGEWRFDDTYLMIDDMGCIYISIDKKGRLHWISSSY